MKSADKSFEVSSLDLNEQTESVNKLIRAVNTINSGVKSPEFGSDLEVSRKDKGKILPRKHLNFLLLLDGVHPNPDLSRLWLLCIIIVPIAVN